MNQIYRKSPFWSLAGPLLAYLAIRWAVEAALMMLILIPYLPDVYAELMQMGSTPSWRVISSRIARLMDLLFSYRNQSGRKQV